VADDDVPTVHHRVVVQRQGDEGWREAVARIPDAPCAWCGGPTPMRALTPFRSDLGSVPMHLICGHDMRAAYLSWRAGHTLSERQAAGFRRLNGGSER
jgi:hypothetical protein